MNAYLILFDKYEEIPSKYWNSIKEDSVVIVAEKKLLIELEKKMSNLNFIYIDLFSDANSEEASRFTEKIMHELSKEYTNLFYKDYDLKEILLNQPFGHINIIFNLVTGIEKILENYPITKLCLHSGNSRCELFPLALSEGERSFRFLYRRSWFLNYYINMAFSKRLRIEWSNQTYSFIIKFIRVIRPIAILFGKVLRVLKRCYIQKDKEAIRTCEKKEAIFFVRNPIQVEPLIPLYNEFKNNREVVPLFVLFENYSNSGLVNKVSVNKLDYYNLYNAMNFRTIINALVSTIRIVMKGVKPKVELIVSKSSIEISLHELITNLTPFIFDVILLETTLSMTFDDSHDICCLINNETHSYHSAFQAEWIKKKNGISYGVQHVTIANKLKPRISRVNKMFMMSQNIANQLSKIKPNETFLFFGPLSYDYYFNKSQHGKVFHEISIFTQPDDFKKDYLEIIEDVINIINKHDLDFQLNIKLHPRERDAAIFEKFSERYSNLSIITNELSSNELVLKSDLIISINSGVIMQSIIIGTPIISVNYDLKHSVDVDFIKHSVTKKAKSKEELESYLLDLEKLNDEYKKNRELFFEENLNNYNGAASKSAYAYIKSEVLN